MAEPWTEIGDRVFVRRHASLDLNIGAVVAEDGVILIDSRATHRQAEELAASLRKISTDPVRWLINTHHHWDHTFGNHVFDEATIWGHARCAEVLATNGEAMRQRLIEGSPENAEAFEEVVITPPSMTFSDSARATFGGIEVAMSHLGRGHTDNDIVISIGEVIFAGDLIEEGAPPSFDDSFLLEWPETLDRLAEISGDVVVPGHGGVASAAFTRLQRSEIDEVGKLARAAHAAGLDPGEAAESTDGPYPKPHMASAFRRVWPQLESP